MRSKHSLSIINNDRKLTWGERPEIVERIYPVPASPAARDPLLLHPGASTDCTHNQRGHEGQRKVGSKHLRVQVDLRERHGLPWPKHD
jgi:hypothetical protein